MTCATIFDKDYVAWSLTIAANVFWQAGKDNFIEMSLEVLLFAMDNVVWVKFWTFSIWIWAVCNDRWIWTLTLF